MDFSRFNNRIPAETPQKVALFDAFMPKGKGEKLLNGKAECAVLIKGPTAPSVEAAQRARRKAKIASGKADPKERDMGNVNDDVCEGAADLIAGFENIERDGKPLTASADDVAWFLGLVYPIMGQAKDGDGEPVMEIAFNRDGDPVSTPKMEMKNYPFAFQIADAAAEFTANLGNVKAG